jgi:hypothetical protein
MLGAGIADGGRAQVAGQQQTMPSSSSSPSPFDHPEDVPPEIRARMDAERARLASNERQKRLAQDADKLVALANELKTDVNKTSKDELSMEVIRKAAEIEKLAHDVQSRMKN